ncbi:DNA polymerase III family [Trichomonas vaginalis G3]|uniref:DNA polymerase III family n=1 Tax=Trichomonas vaginalis (strain ATCC PRA-98 / G3) TaxID=412133 RepID=UPI0021E606D1|nr:DNA polymerase III family [Trichomonas vaginalis G3]KAI5537857.1 DNA polymerase III family [Trichomonas vaginalis G3]
MFLENKSVINSLEGDLINKSYSHAYLFSGSKGIGKFSHAKNFARAILREAPEGIRFFSGIDDFEDADLFVVQKKDAIKKQDIEEIIENSFSKPFSGSHKIVIIDDFDQVTDEGQNALLKTLEEPMDYLILILISSNMRNILPTIISRCRILKFQDLTQDRLEEFLLSRKLSPRNAKLFSRLSNGDVSLAIKYSENPEFLSKREDIINMIDRIIRKTEFIFDEMKFLKDKKDDFNDILNFMIIWYLDLVYMKTGREDLVVNIDKLDLLKLQDLSIDRAINSYDALINALGRKGKNVNFDLNIEKLLIDLGGVR